MVLCNTNTNGCNGGTLYNSWNYFKTTGIQNYVCLEYPENDGQFDDTVYNGSCPNKCSSDNTIQWTNKMLVTSFTKLSAKTDGYQKIMTEIMTNGPVQVGFTVYKDFFSFESGVYRYDGVSPQAGGHAVTVVGWDHDSNNNLYWIIKNTWGDDWGMNG